MCAIIPFVQCDDECGAGWFVFWRDVRYDEELATTDPITALPLAKVHVDWQSPDGSLRMCYNLATLRDIAKAKGMWMQPPHFRTALDQDLVAQIRARFHVDTSVYRPADHDDLQSTSRVAPFPFCPARLVGACLLLAVGKM